MFHYSLIATVTIGKKEFEFSKEFESPCQFRAGDGLYIDGWESCRINYVTWYVDDPGSAFMQLEEFECEGSARGWAWMVPEVLDTVIPCLEDNDGERSRDGESDGQT